MNKEAKNVTIARHAYITKTPLWEQRDMLSRKNGPHATVYMVNGDRYLGEWRENKKHGNGTYFYNATGSIYEGEWRNDKRDGFGTFATPVAAATASGNGNGGGVGGDALVLRKVYAGQWCNDKRHGTGTYFFEDGSWYEGRWADDMKEGWGRMNYADGSIYDGEWCREMRQGQGVLLLGDRYEGMWLEDLKEGPGKFVYKTKRQMYEGEWSKGLPKCGTLVDLPPLIGHLPKKYPIPEIKLADPDDVLEKQREEIRENRTLRMMVHVTPEC